MKLFATITLALNLLLSISQIPAKGFTLDAFTDFEGSNNFQAASTSNFDPNGTTVFDTDTGLDSTLC